MEPEKLELGLNAKPITCPQCGFEYVHIVQLKCLRGNDETKITNQGILVHEAKNEGRGVKTTLEYVCENGHHGNIIFDFHKEMSYYKHEVLPETKDFQDIWRD